MSIIKHRKRGFIMELESKLNELLADLNVFYRKLQNYHWNVEGKDFFQVHAKLEELYIKIYEQIDEIAEHIVILKGQPLGTLKDYMEKSIIQEAENKKIKSEEIYRNLITDYQKLKDKTISIKEEADNQREYATSSLIDEYIMEYGKIIWMLKASLS